MGRLTYDGTDSTTFDDRTLAHLQVVIAAKLRRGEAFNFSWVKSPEEGSGRTTLWIHPAIPLKYEFDGSRLPRINRAWLESLMATANSGVGLTVTPEPVTEQTESSPEEPATASGAA